MFSMSGIGPVCQSMVPAASASAPAWLPDSDEVADLSSPSGSPPQYSGLAVKVKACGLKSPSRYGAGADRLLDDVARSGSMSFQMCSGTIGSCRARRARARRTARRT